MNCKKCKFGKSTCVYDHKIAEIDLSWYCEVTKKWTNNTKATDGEPCNYFEKVEE